MEMHRWCINLPRSIFTEWYLQMDLKLRMDHHAQCEIQECGRAMAEVAKLSVHRLPPQGIRRQAQ